MILTEACFCCFRKQGDSRGCLKGEEVESFLTAGTVKGRRLSVCGYDGGKLDGLGTE